MKKVLYITSILIILFTAACNNESKNNGEKKSENVVENNATINSNPVELAAAKEAASKQIDMLEKLFDNQNYMAANGKDTSYFYFSRLSKYNLYTHSYKLIKGDSANLQVDTIQLNNGKLQWNWKGRQLVLNSVTDYMSSWIANGDEKNKIEFQRIDNRTISMQIGGNKQLLHKTLALSLFLVRSYYDYQHGTKYAQDTADNFKPKAGKPIK